jgi:hypothetical protein
MKALTIRQPWAHAILNLGKDVENRSWRRNYRGPVLIHAGSYNERHPRKRLAEYMQRPPSVKSLADLPKGFIVGIVEIVDYVKNSKSRWADKGYWHWIIGNPRRIRPIQCTGRLMLWKPSPTVMKKLPVWVRKLDRS